MKKILLATSVALSLTATAQELETITVVGTKPQTIETNPVMDLQFMESIQPLSVYTPGGYGGFAGFSERGTQTIHTAVYRNGVPANDPGSGWYDFGHDLSTGNEQLQYVSGPNGVLYGSGSLGGAVFVNDVIKQGYIVRGGNEHAFVSASPTDFFNLTYFDVNNGSVRTDNNEDDHYENITAKISEDIADVTVTGTYTDYDYDYDNCYTQFWSPSNDCVQTGTRGFVSVRNDNFTLGYNKTKSKYYTEDTETWSSSAERYYADYRDSFAVTDSVTAIVGVSADKEKYMGEQQTVYGLYSVANYDDVVDVGVRITNDATVARIGAEYKGILFNLGSSYRQPSLYELNGDEWVAPNKGLDPEEAVGGEVSLGSATVFYYQFSEGIDYSFSLSQFVNTGEYVSKGLRWQDTYALPVGSLSVYAAYTDTEQLRVPKYGVSLDYAVQVSNITYAISYTGGFERGKEFTGVAIDDVSTIDVSASWKVNNRVTAVFSIEDLLDNEFEIVPDYAAGGRTALVTLFYQ